MNSQLAFKIYHTVATQADMCVSVCVSVHMSICVPVSDPGGHVVRDVSSVRVPVPAGQLFDLQSEVS